MSNKTGIAWTSATWNCLVGCSRVSAGCEHCYAERVVHRGLSPQHRGLTTIVNGTPHWTGEVRLVESAMDLPLRWKKPRRIFVNSLSDVFHEKVPDEWVGRMIGVMGSCPQHTFQVLTKRPERMRDFFTRNARPGGQLVKPLQNVWLGVSVEDQATADARIPLLLQTPAALRFVSYEPALGPVDFEPFITTGYDDHLLMDQRRKTPNAARLRVIASYGRRPYLEWLIIGGESGPGARPFDLAWARSAIAQGRAAGVATFFKQAGSRPIFGGTPLRLKDRKGGDLSELPAEFHVREFPDA